MRNGFTLVEMLGATLLSALLMAAILSVVTSLGRTQRAFDSATAAADDSADVLALLRFDLANARDVDVDPNKLTIRGVGGLTRDTLRPTHRPAEVAYELEEVAGRRWLVRSQRELDVLSNRRPMRRPLRADVTGFACELLGEEPDVPPRAVRVTVETPDAPPAREVIVVR